MNVQEFAELAAGHALNALSPEDEQAYETALAAHPEWAAIAQMDAATAAELAQGVAEVQPPAQVRQALLAIIASEPPAGAPAALDEGDSDREPDTESRSAVEPPLDTEAIQTISRRTWMRGLFVLAASLVLLFALGTGVGILANRLHEPAAVAALSQIEAAPDAQETTAPVEGGGHATLQWSDDVGKAVVVTDGVTDLDRDHTYQLWFVRDGVMVSAGLFSTNPDGSATALLSAPVQAGDAVAITVESKGGSPTGQPTSDPVTTLPTA